MEKRSIDFLPQIDGLRFVAVFGVMLQHWTSQNFQSSYVLGHIPFGAGVNLFFVISGFLISYILLKKKQEITENSTTFLKEIGNFYVKRTLRIFPIYYLLIILLIIFSYDQIKAYLIYLITYSVNWYIVYNKIFIGNKSHLWSLAVEEQFYLIWPFIILLIPKRFILTSIIVAVLVSLVSKVYFYNSPYGMGVNGATFSCFDSFGFGAIIAYFNFFYQSKFDVRMFKYLLYLSILVYILLFINPMFMGQTERTLFFNFSTSVIFFFFVFIASNNGFSGGFKSFLENKIILYFGKISYGLYIYHNFIPDIYFSGLNKFLPNMKGDFDLFLIYFTLTLIVSIISWNLIEKPLLGLKRHFT